MGSSQLIVGELQDIAASIERRADLSPADRKRFATRIDMACNEIDVRHRARRRAGMNSDLTSGKNVGGGGGDFNPGWETNVPDHDQDSLQVKPRQYGRVPKGPRNVQGVGLGIDNATGEGRKTGPSSIKDYDLEFASEDPVYIMASRRRRADSEGEASNFDPGDPLDPFTTAGLPESGNEALEPPPDKDQTGGKLQMFNAKPYENKKKHAALQRRRAARARQILEEEANVGRRSAGEVIFKDPNNLHRDEEGDEVVRDQDLGGMGNDTAYQDSYSSGGTSHGKSGEHFDFEDDDLPVEDDELREALGGGEETDDHFDSEGEGSERTGTRGAPDADAADAFGGEQPGEMGDMDAEHLPPTKKRGPDVRQASGRIAVYRPKAIPKALEPLWHGAIKRVSARGELVQNNKVNYAALVADYKALLAHAHQKV